MIIIVTTGRRQALMAHWPWSDDNEGRWRSSTSRPKAPVRWPRAGRRRWVWPAMARRDQEQDEVRLVAACKSPALCRRVQAEAVRTYGHQQQWPKELEAVWPTAADVHTRKGGKPTRRRQKCRKLPFLARRKRSQVTGWAHPMGEALRWAAGAKCPSNARGPRWPPEPTKCVMCRRHAGPVP